MTVDQIITLIVGVAAALLALHGGYNIYQQQKRDRDRELRENAQHEQIKSSIENLAKIIDAQLAMLSKRSDEQSQAIRDLSKKTAHMDQAIYGIDKRLAVVEERDKANRRHAEKASN